MTRRVIAATLALMVCGVVAAHAQLTIDPDTVRAAVTAGAGAAPAGAAPGLTAKYYAERERYEIEALGRRAASFEWQYRSSQIIFAVVLAIIATGMVLSYQQFRSSLRAGAAAPPATTLKLGTAGVEINSSIVGLIILVVSLAFF